MTSVFLLCLLACIGPVLISAQSDTMWRVEEYPNPLHYPQRCGRHKEIKRGSWICDPTSIITPEDADAIDELVKQNEAQTRCCAQCPNGPTGFVIMVALVPRTYRIVNASNAARDIFYDMKVYAYYLSLYWKVEVNCRNKIIILYDKYHNVVYTITEKDARAALPNQKIQDITLDNWEYFRKGDKKSIAMGLKRIISDYSNVLPKQRQ